jgi:hypothetical protein
MTNSSKRTPAVVFFPVEAQAMVLDAEKGGFL